MDQYTEHGDIGHQAVSRAGVAPAEGERRAVSGYHHQYRTSACMILRKLRSGRLRWIRLADPKAGRVDDLQIGSAGQIDAYQVKSSQYPGSFTFNNLTTSQTDHRRLSHKWPKDGEVLNNKTPDSGSSST